MQIDEALDLFLVQLDADGRSSHTRAQYARHVRVLARWYDGPIERITHEDLAKFLVSPEARLRPDGKPKKPTAMNALRTSVRCFFSYLAASGTLPRDPARLVRRARCAPAPPRGLSEGDQRRLTDELARATDPEGRRDRALFTVMLGTGIRVGSAVALDVDDVDLERSELRLRTTKGDRPVVVFLPRAVLELLRSYLAGRPGGPLFPGRRGERISTRHVARRLSHWLRQAGVERRGSPHSLRHAFAERIIARTGDLLLTQAALGHASIMSTTVYARADGARLRALMQG